MHFPICKFYNYFYHMEEFFLSSHGIPLYKPNSIGRSVDVFRVYDDHRNGARS